MLVDLINPCAVANTFVLIVFNITGLSANIIRTVLTAKMKLINYCFTPGFNCRKNCDKEKRKKLLGDLQELLHGKIKNVRNIKHVYF